MVESHLDYSISGSLCINGDTGLWVYIPACGAQIDFILCLLVERGVSPYGLLNLVQPFVDLYTKALFPIDAGIVRIKNYKHWYVENLVLTFVT